MVSKLQTKCGLTVNVVFLVCCSRQYVKPMNFQEEVRAHRDLDNFLAQASILLDERAATLDEVLRRMLTHVAADCHETCDVDEVMNSMFTDAGGRECNGESDQANQRAN